MGIHKTEKKLLSHEKISSFKMEKRKTGELIVPGPGLLRIPGKFGSGKKPPGLGSINRPPGLSSMSAAKRSSSNDSDGSAKTARSALSKR